MCRKRRIEWGVLVLVLLAAWPCTVRSQEHVRLIHADLFKREAVGQKIIQRVEGNVKFRQGDTSIECDVATQVVDADPIELIGHVRIIDPKRTLLADTVQVFEKTGVQIAVGHVVSITEKDTTFAHRLTYFEKENKVVSDEDVQIVNPKERSVLTGGHAEYLREQEYGKIFEHPMLVKLDSLGTETMRIVSDTMETFEGGARTVVRGDVKISQPRTRATCGKAEYFREEEKMILSESPTVYRTNQTITGDTLFLYLEDSKLSKAVVQGHALATADADTTHKGKWINKLSGEKMTFYFEEGDLRTVVIEQQASSLYHIIDENQYKGANEVTGDQISIEFVDGEATKVLVQSEPGTSTGKYRPPQ